MLARIAAFIVGLIVLLFALVFTLGAGILVPIGMGVGGLILRRRGRRFGLLEGWMSGVITFGVVVCVAAIVANTVGPFREEFAKMELLADSAQRHPAPLPPLLRQLGAQPAPALSPSVAKPFFVIGMLMGLEFVCLFMGTIAWAGTALLVFGARGARAREPDAAP